MPKKRTHNQAKVNATSAQASPPEKLEKPAKVLRFSQSIATKSEATTEIKIDKDVFQLHTFADIKSYITIGGIVVLDLDNTVEETTTQLGSDQWFRAYLARETERLGDALAATNKTVRLYNRVHKLARVKPVEDDIPDIIKAWQDSGYDVVALTTRGTEIADDTVRQLADINVNFNHGRFKHMNIDLKQGSASRAINGIIFCGGKSKDVCLTTFIDELEHLEWKPKQIVFVDDHLANVLKVRLTAEQFGIPYVGLRYGRLDEEVKRVDLALTDVQLSAMDEIISTEEAKLLKDFRTKQAEERADQAQTLLRLRTTLAL